MRPLDIDGEPRRHVVAGLLLRCPDPLPGLPLEGFHDGEVRLRVVERAGEGGDWWEAPVSGPARVRVRADGAEIEAVRAGASPEDLAVAVRSTLPFAAALQRKVTLHAAGISVLEKTVAVVGASGAGKSTLAATLEAGGQRLVADDLLPVRLLAGRVMVPSCRFPERQLDPLDGVFFLLRQPGLEEPVLKRLRSRNCLAQLIRHGFGEVAQSAAWSAQVEVYHHIAEQVRAFEIRVPDDRERLMEIATWFASMSQRELR